MNPINGAVVEKPQIDRAGTTFDPNWSDNLSSVQDETETIVDWGEVDRRIGRGLIVAGIEVERQSRGARDVPHLRSWLMEPTAV